MNYPVILSVIGAIGVPTLVGGGWWGIETVVNAVVEKKFAELEDTDDGHNRLILRNREEIKTVGKRQDINTYDNLLRKLTAQGRLSGRDLAAFCAAAKRLGIGHAACSR